jgi:glycosyltransferase involved in cell wall biosynthesis
MIKNTTDIPVINKTETGLKINLICQFPFPYGYSGTNRILSYAIGLVDLGHKVMVNLLSPTEDRSHVLNTEPVGIFNGIYFEYPFKNTIRSNYLLIRAPQVAFGYLKTFYNILRTRVNSSTDILLISNDNPFLLFPLVLFSRLTGIKKNVLIVDEYPIPVRLGSEKLPFLRRIFYRLSFKMIDGFIHMTNAIHYFYLPYFSSKTKAHLMPMTVEMERFSAETGDKSENIVYIGDLDIKKDGVDILIRSFAAICNDYLRLKLNLYGKGTEENDRVLRKLVTELDLDERVTFFGKVSRDIVPGILKEAKILALSRPSSLRASAGFPTKLGEYLASATPVVVTKVGEIPEYLSHMKNAYLAEPDSIEDFALKLRDVLNNYDEAIAIGANGSVVANTYFSSKVQSEKLSVFLNSLLS